MTDHRTKLLRMIEDTVCNSPDNSRIIAQNIIEVTADWFEEVIQQIGVQPSSIPTLLRWQAHHHEYVDDTYDEVEV